MGDVEKTIREMTAEAVEWLDSHIGPTWRESPESAVKLMERCFPDPPSIPRLVNGNARPSDEEEAWKDLRYSGIRSFKATYEDPKGDDLLALVTAPSSVDWPKVREHYPDLPWNEDAFEKGDDQC